jgi:hypothetical protein
MLRQTCRWISVARITGLVATQGSKGRARASGVPGNAGADGGVRDGNLAAVVWWMS